MNNKATLPFKKSHAFIIGINDYQKLPKLKTAVNDAKKLAEVLAEVQKFTVHPPLLDACKKDIEHLLQKTMKDKVGKEDRVFLYFAGHGIALDGEEKPEGYIVPADADSLDDSKLISMQTLHDAVSRLTCPHLLLVLDCCFSGSFKWASRHRNLVTLMPKRIFKERFDFYVKDPAWQVITSAAHDQKALDVLKGIEKPIGKRDDEGMDHSPFASFLFEGLLGKADYVMAGEAEGDGLITASELYLYLRKKVETKTTAFNEKYRQTPGIFPLEKHDKGEYIFLHPNHRGNLPPIPKREPYKGLKSFEEKDKELFYGRERVIEDLLQKVNETGLIVVTGASGTGKSSVVKAGLIPELRNHGYNILPVMRPGENPFSTLKNTLNRSALPGIKFPPGNHPAPLPKTNIREKTVLVIDQFEELVTQCSSREYRNRFLEILETLLESGQNNLFKIIVTVRADFEPHFSDSLLKKYWKEARYTVPPFKLEELREVVEKPAVQEVLFFEPPALIDRLINEVIQAPGALPLLSFTLFELYRLSIKNNRQRTLHEDDYKDLGGVIGALHKRADDLFNDMDRKHQNTLRKIILRMISIEGSEPAGKKVLIKELEFSQEENRRVKNVIARLLEARLIIKDKDENNRIYVEPAHDALVRAWATLWKWIEDHGKDKISLQNRLGRAVKDYAVRKDKKYLWHKNPRLELVKDELKSPNSLLNKHETVFVEESIKHKRRGKNRAWTIAVSIIILLSFLSTFALKQRNNALKEARIAKARHFTSQARLNLADEPITAIRFAEKAYHLKKSETVMLILSAAAASTIERPFYSLKMRHNHSVNDVKFSPSGQKILTASSDKTAKLWDLKGNLLKTFPHASIVYYGEFSPDGTVILTVSGGNRVKLWDLQGNLIARLDKHSGMITTAVFSPDGSKILTASADETAKLWDLQGNLIADLDIHNGMVTAAVFSPDGTKVLTASRDKTAVLWDLRNQPAVELNLQRAAVTFAVFSPRGNRVLIVSRDNTLKMRDLYGNLETGIEGHKKPVNSVVFSPDGMKILTASADKTAKMWNLKGKLLKEFSRHTANVKSAVFSPDGRLVLTASFDKTAKLWDLQGNLLLSLDKHTMALSGAVFSPDGARLLTASHDRTARLWDLQGKLLNTFYMHDEPVKTAIFSPDGRKVLTVAHDAVLWDLQGQPLADFKRRADSKLKMELELGDCVSALFSPDGSRVLTTGLDKKVLLWDLQGHPLVEFKGHRGVITSALFSPDGTKILTASSDQTVKLWDLHGNILSDFDKHKGIVYSAVFSPDGKRILSASGDNTVKLQYTPEAVIQWLKTAKIPALSLEENHMKRMNIKETNKWRLQ